MDDQAVFAVFDSKVNAYMRPWFAPNESVALRAFRKAATTADHDFCVFAGDFTLFRIGTWDAHSGIIEMLDVHFNLGTALQVQNLKDE